MSVKKIENFINEKQNWIQKKQANESKFHPKQGMQIGNQYLFWVSGILYLHIGSGNPLNFDGQSFQAQHST
ncbi:MAG: hypothetical protein H0A76_13415 [Candidatus Thiodubiliella endoseptemdiera]|uniref:Uncharacterized protein n=1 Tax=Candidatus Thiodubiliella endoseptemdiera TaxID=2738886 RepID=A0A853F527_9GAMM|nr:hypothetical protein [Candidatus Thiodubiliella endoseptemdiera]